MKSFLKTIIFVAVMVAAIFFVRNNGGGAILGIKGWAERTAEHLESLAVTSDEENGTGEEQAPEANENWYASMPSETSSSAGGAEITSHIGLSSAGGDSEIQNSAVVGREVRNKFQGRSESENMQWVKEVTERYAPNAWNLLMLYDALPAYQTVESVDEMVMTMQKTASTFAYMDGGSATELLGEMATNVHEIAHGFCRHYPFSHARENRIKMNLDDASLAYYLSPSTIYMVSFPTASLFPSAELVSEIPRDLRTFRFDTYVNGRTSTQSEGVLGLLNEFHAYYLGSRCGYDLLEAYVLAEGSVALGFLEWIRAIQSSMTAYWEFDFFIREYLLHMSMYYPDDYALLVRQGEFTRTYSAFRKAYSDLIIRYDNRVAEMVGKLNGKDGYEAYIKEGTVWISHQSSTRITGAQLFGEDRNVLEPVLSSRRYDRIEECLSGQ